MNYKKKLSSIVLIALFSLMGAFILSACEKEEKAAETVQAESKQLWTCGMHPEVIVDEPGNCPKCGMKLVPVKQTGSQPAATQTDGQAQQKKNGKVLYWRAPMDPTEIYDHPGKSKMGMDLIPVYEGEEAVGAGGTITIDPVTVQNMGVRYGKVERMDFSRLIRTVGEINFNEDKLYDINTKISGWIENLYVNYTGEIVKKGQPLLEIYSPELVTTQEEYLLALKTRKLVSGSSFESIREGGESLLESTRKRLLYWDIPSSEIERLEKTGEVRKSIQLRAPAGGMVVERNVVDGAHVKAGEKLFRIANLSSVWVHASIYDYEVPWVREGQPAEMELSYEPGKTYQGKVAYIYPYLREKARDVHVRLEFSNPDLDLKPGMYVNVQLQGRTIPNALVVPSEAVIRSGRRNVVFVTREPGKFEPREIRIGEEGGPGNRYLRVLSGLLEDETVVTSAQFMLDSESRLQEAIQKMLEERRAGSQPKPEQPAHQMEEMDQQQSEHQHQMEGMEQKQPEHQHNMEDMKQQKEHQH